MHFGALKLYIRGNSTKEQKILKINEYIAEGGCVRYNDGSGNMLYWAIYSECEIEVIEHIATLYDKIDFNAATEEFEIFNGVIDFCLYPVAHLLEKYAGILAFELVSKLKWMKLFNEMGIQILHTIYEGEEDCCLESDSFADTTVFSHLPDISTVDEFHY